MNLTKKLVLRLAKDAGLSDDGLKKLERDLDLVQEARDAVESQPVKVVPVPPVVMPQPIVYPEPQSYPWKYRRPPWLTPNEPWLTNQTGGINKTLHTFS